MSNKLYESDSIDYAVRSPLQGETAGIAIHMRLNASISHILSKLTLYIEMFDLLGYLFSEHDKERMTM